MKGALEDGKRLFGDVLRSIVDASPAKASTKATPTSSAAHSSPIRCHTYSEPPLAVLKEDVHTFSHFHQLRLKEEEGTILERRARKLERISALKRRADDEALQQMRNDPAYLGRCATLIQRNIRRWQGQRRWHGYRQNLLGVRCADGGGGGASVDGGVLMLELVQDVPADNLSRVPTVWDTVSSCRLVAGTAPPAVPPGRHMSINYLTGVSTVVKQRQAPPPSLSSTDVPPAEVPPFRVPPSTPIPQHVKGLLSEESRYFASYRRLQPHSKIALIVIVDSYPHQPRVAVDPFVTSQGFALVQTLKALGYGVTLMSTKPLVATGEVEEWGPSSTASVSDGYVHHVMCPTKDHILREVQHFALLAGTPSDPTVAGATSGPQRRSQTTSPSSLPVAWLHVCGTGGYGSVDGRPSHVQGNWGSQTAGHRMLSALDDIPRGVDTTTAPSSVISKKQPLSQMGSARGGQLVRRKGLGTATATLVQRRKERTNRSYQRYQFKSFLGPALNARILTTGRVPQRSTAGSPPQRDVELFKSQAGYDREQRMEEAAEEDLAWKMAYLGRPRRTRHWRLITNNSENSPRLAKKESALLNRNRSLKQVKSSAGHSTERSESSGSSPEVDAADSSDSKDDEGTRGGGGDLLQEQANRVVDEELSGIPGRTERESTPFLLPSDVRVSGYQRAHSDEVITMDELVSLFMHGSSSNNIPKNAPPQQKLFSFDVSAAGCDGNLGPFSAFITSTSGGTVYKPTRARKDALFDDTIDTVLFGKTQFRKALSAYPSFDGAQEVADTAAAVPTSRLVPVDDIRADVATSHMAFLNGLSISTLMHGKLTYSIVQGLQGYAWSLSKGEGFTPGEEPPASGDHLLSTLTQTQRDSGSVFVPTGGVRPQDVERILMETALSQRKAVAGIEEYISRKRVLLLEKQQQEEMARPTFRSGTQPSSKLDAVVASNLSDERKAALSDLPVSVVRVAVSLVPASSGRRDDAIPTPQVHSKGLADFVECFMSAHGIRGQPVTTGRRPINQRSGGSTYGPAGLSQESTASIVVASGMRLLSSLSADAPASTRSGEGVSEAALPRSFAQTPMDGAALQLAAFDALSRANSDATIPHETTSARSAICMLPASLTLGGGRIYGGGVQPSILAMYAMNCLLAMKPESPSPPKTDGVIAKASTDQLKRDRLWSYVNSRIVKCVIDQEMTVSIPMYIPQKASRLTAKLESSNGRPPPAAVATIRDCLLKSARHSQRDTQHTLEVTIRFDETTEYYQEVNDFYIAALTSEMTTLQEASSIYASTSNRISNTGTRQKRKSTADNEHPSSTAEAFKKYAQLANRSSNEAAQFGKALYQLTMLQQMRAVAYGAKSNVFVAGGGAAGGGGKAAAAESTEGGVDGGKVNQGGGHFQASSFTTFQEYIQSLSNAAGKNKSPTGCLFDGSPATAGLDNITLFPHSFLPPQIHPSILCTGCVPAPPLPSTLSIENQTHALLQSWGIPTGAVVNLASIAAASAPSQQLLTSSSVANRPGASAPSGPRKLGALDKVPLPPLVSSDGSSAGDVLNLPKPSVLLRCLRPSIDPEFLGFLTQYLCLSANPDITPYATLKSLMTPLALGHGATTFAAIVSSMMVVPNATGQAASTSANAAPAASIPLKAIAASVLSTSKHHGGGNAHTDTHVSTIEVGTPHCVQRKNLVLYFHVPGATPSTAIGEIENALLNKKTTWGEVVAFLLQGVGEYFEHYARYQLQTVASAAAAVRSQRESKTTPHQAGTDRGSSPGADPTHLSEKERVEALTLKHRLQDTFHLPPSLDDSVTQRQQQQANRRPGPFRDNGTPFVLQEVSEATAKRLLSAAPSRRFRYLSARKSALRNAMHQQRQGCGEDEPAAQVQQSALLGVSGEVDALYYTVTPTPEIPVQSVTNAPNEDSDEPEAAEFSDSPDMEGGTNTTTSNEKASWRPGANNVNHRRGKRTAFNDIGDLRRKMRVRPVQMVSGVRLTIHDVTDEMYACAMARLPLLTEHSPFFSSIPFSTLSTVTTFSSAAASSANGGVHIHEASSRSRGAIPIYCPSLAASAVYPFSSLDAQHYLRSAHTARLSQLHNTNTNNSSWLGKQMGGGLQQQARSVGGASIVPRFPFHVPLMDEAQTSSGRPLIQPPFLHHRADLSPFYPLALPTNMRLSQASRTALFTAEAPNQQEAAVATAATPSFASPVGVDSTSRAMAALMDALPAVYTGGVQATCHSGSEVVDTSASLEGRIRPPGGMQTSPTKGGRGSPTRTSPSKRAGGGGGGSGAAGPVDVGRSSYSWSLTSIHPSYSRHRHNDDANPDDQNNSESGAQDGDDGTTATNRTSNGNDKPRGLLSAFPLSTVAPSSLSHNAPPPPPTPYYASAFLPGVRLAKVAVDVVIEATMSSASALALQSQITATKPLLPNVTLIPKVAAELADGVLAGDEDDRGEGFPLAMRLKRRQSTRPPSVVGGPELPGMDPPATLCGSDAIRSVRQAPNPPSLLSEQHYTTAARYYRPLASSPVDGSLAKSGHHPPAEERDDILRERRRIVFRRRQQRQRMLDPYPVLISDTRTLPSIAQQNQPLHASSPTRTKPLPLTAEALPPPDPSDMAISVLRPHMEGGRHKRRSGCRRRYELASYAREFNRTWSFSPVAIADLPDLSRSDYFVFLQSMLLYNRTVGNASGSGDGALMGKLPQPQAFPLTSHASSSSGAVGVLGIIQQYSFSPAATSAASLQRQVKMMRRFATVSSTNEMAQALKRPAGNPERSNNTFTVALGEAQVDGERLRDVPVSNVSTTYLYPMISIVGVSPVASSATASWTDETLTGLLALRPNSCGLPGKGGATREKPGGLPDIGDVSFAPAQRVYGAPIANGNTIGQAPPLTPPAGSMLSGSGSQGDIGGPSMTTSRQLVTVSPAASGSVLLYELLAKVRTAAGDTAAAAVERALGAPTIPYTCLRRLSQVLTSLTRNHQAESHLSAIKQWCFTLDVNFDSVAPKTLVPERSAIDHNGAFERAPSSNSLPTGEDKVAAPESRIGDGEQQLSSGNLKGQGQKAVADQQQQQSATASPTATTSSAVTTISAAAQLLTVPRSDTTGLLTIAASAFSDYYQSLSSTHAGGSDHYDGGGSEEGNIEDVLPTSQQVDLASLFHEVDRAAKRIHEGLNNVFPLFSVFHGVSQFVRPDVPIDDFRALMSSSKWFASSPPTATANAIANSPIPFKDLTLAVTEAKFWALNRDGPVGTPLALVRVYQLATSLLQRVQNQLPADISSDRDVEMLVAVAATISGIYDLLSTIHRILLTAHRCKETMLTHVIDEVRTVLTCTFPVIPLAFSFGLLDKHGSPTGGLDAPDSFGEDAMSTHQTIVKESFKSTKVSVGASSEMIQGMVSALAKQGMEVPPPGSMSLLSKPVALAGNNSTGSKQDAPSPSQSPKRPGATFLTRGSRAGGVVSGGGGVILTTADIDVKSPTQLRKEAIRDLSMGITSSLQAIENIVPSTERELTRHIAQANNLSRFFKKCLALAHHRSQLLESYLSGQANENAQRQQQRMLVLSSVVPRQSQPFYQLMGRAAHFGLSIPPAVPQAPILHQQPAICMFVYFKPSSSSSSFPSPSNNLVSIQIPTGGTSKTPVTSPPSGSNGVSSPPGLRKKVFGSKGGQSVGEKGMRVGHNNEAIDSSSSTFLTGGESTSAMVSPKGGPRALPGVSASSASAEPATAPAPSMTSNTDAMHAQFREFLQAKKRFSHHTNLHFTTWNVADVWSSGLHGGGGGGQHGLSSSFVGSTSNFGSDSGFEMSSPAHHPTVVIPTRSDPHPLSGILSLIKATHGSPTTDLPIVLLVEPQTRKAYYIKWQHCEFMDADTIEPFCEDYLLGALKDLLPPVSGVRIVGPPQKVRYSMLGSF